MVKLEKKSCDLMILNGPQAIDADSNQVEIMDHNGGILDVLVGPKTEVAKSILQVIDSRLIKS